MVFFREEFEEQVAKMPLFKGSKGSIVRLRIHDFMTYKDVEMRAGPNVNLIVGPNGTGKSTIVCAICIALAGKPKILGRATSLKEYIRHGASTASIEIELYNSDDTSKNWIVQRVITETQNQARSDWFLNGKRSTETAIEQLMNSLNIHLDNLCQFLPQDRVQDFSLMDKVQMLKSTEKAVDGDNGYQLGEKHAQLEELQQKIKQTDAALRQYEEKLRISHQDNHRVAGDVHVYLERKRFTDQIVALQGKKLWLIYKKKMAHFTQLKERYEELKRKKEKEEKMLEPLQKDIKKMTGILEAKRSELTRLEIQTNKCIEGIRKQLRKVQEDAESDISRFTAEYNQQVNYEKDRIRQLEVHKEKLAATEQELEDFRLNRDHDNNEEALRAEIDEIQMQQDQLNTKIFELDALQEPDLANARVKQHRLNSVEAELDTMNQLRNSRLKYLQRHHPEVYRGVDFFFNNPANRAEFKGEIHEPLILNIFITDFNYGKVAERCIQRSDLVAFYVEDASDVQTMISLAFANKIGKVSVIHHRKPDWFKKPSSTLTQQMMRKYDFQKSLVDLIQVDDYYMSYLVKTIKPQDIHIGSDVTDNMMDDIVQHTNLHSFYTKNKGYRVKSSMYRAVKNTSINHLTDATIFTDQINALETHTLQETQKKLRLEIAELNRSVMERKIRSDALKVDRDQLETKKTSIKLRIQNKKQLENKIARCKETIQNIEAEQQDLSQLKQKMEHLKRLAMAKVDKQNEIYVKDCTKFAENGYELRMRKGEIKQIHNWVMTSTNQFEEYKSTVNSYVNELRSVETQKKVAAEEANKAGTEAREETGRKEPPEDVANDGVTEEELEAEKKRNEVQLSFLHTVDDKTITEFHTRKKKIEEMEKTKKEWERKLAEYRVEMERNKLEFLDPLKDLIERINNNFGTYFMKMHCVGEVSLEQGEDENDFARYGVKIMVKFRPTEPLAEFNRTQQSGGERAITTALYILALQELTKVPFRVIDEINQGMDAKNEKRLFHLLCDMAQGEDTCQYFLLTPKMLPPVEYPDNVDFHIILNGPFVRVSEGEEWDGDGGGQVGYEDSEPSSSEADD